MSPKAIFGLVKDTFKDWSEDKAARLGAALAYYTILSYHHPNYPTSPHYLLKNLCVLCHLCVFAVK